MVATASAQKRRSAAVERPDTVEAEQGTHGHERCQHVAKAKRRKGELASPSSACTAATPSPSGAPSERHATQAAHRESEPAGAGAAALPSTSGRQADAAACGKPRRTHEIDALFSAKQKRPEKVSPLCSSPVLAESSHPYGAAVSVSGASGRRRWPSRLLLRSLRQHWVTRMTSLAAGQRGPGAPTPGTA